MFICLFIHIYIQSRKPSKVDVGGRRLRRSEQRKERRSGPGSPSTGNPLNSTLNP